MPKIMIVGAGRVGIALAKILHVGAPDELHIVDSSDVATAAAIATLQPLNGKFCFHTASEQLLDDLMQAVKPDVVVCSTPFSVNKRVAELAVKHSVHYVDFTEDVAVTNYINGLDVGYLTFVPQTGLAPGLINYIGLDLFKNLAEPHSLSLRVGALPQASFGPANYAITWSPEGLINEYINPAVRLRNFITETVPALDDHETLVINGVAYEGFNTSGGVGLLSAYTDIPHVEYKTLRYPGHLEYILKLLARTNFDFEESVKLAKRTFPRTRDDVVVLFAAATDQLGMMATAAMHFYPHDELGLTALELTTAGTGAAVVELILAGKLARGVLSPRQVPMDLLRQTKAYELIFSSAR